MIEFCYTLRTDISVDSAMPLLRLSCLYDIELLQYVFYMIIKE